MGTWFETSKAGYDLIKRFEGCELTAYKKGADPWTVGWGITGAMPDGRPVTEGLTISQKEADEALEWFVRNVSDPLVRKHFNAKSQAEFDALSSWTYNLNHAKLERGQYSLPALVNQRERDLNALIGKWVEYVNPKTIFEQGLYRRRLAEVCMFLGLPWHFALSASLKRINGIVADRTDPFYIIDLAEAARDAAKPVPSLPDPPKAPKPVVPVETKPLPEIAKAPEVKTTTVKKPPSPNTKAPAEVGLDPNAGLKHVSESERAKGWMWKNIGIMLLRFSTLGIFGNAAMVGSQTLMADQMLLNAVFELWVPLAINGGTLATSYVAYHYGKWTEYQGRAKGTQALYV